MDLSLMLMALRSLFIILVLVVPELILCECEDIGLVEVNVLVHQVEIFFVLMV